MKRISAIVAAVVLLTIASIPASSQKAKQDSRSFLEAYFLSNAPVVAKPIIYQLTDEEGGTDEANGRKVPAVIYHHYFDGRRDDNGRLLDRIQFVTPDGRTVLKDAPYDSSRSPGTWDTIQPGDLRS